MSKKMDPLATDRTQPLPSKLTPPTLPKIVLRPRLFRELDRARTRPIIWIAASPGAGKTTLVASYLHARRLRPLWYTMDERDGDLATFFHYLSLAARPLAPRKSTPLPPSDAGVFAGRVRVHAQCLRDARRATAEIRRAGLG